MAGLVKSAQNLNLRAPGSSPASRQEPAVVGGVLAMGASLLARVVMAGPAAKRPANKTAAKKSSARRKTERGASKRGARRWSKHVTETSDALDLKGGVFTLRDPKKIAASLKRSAEHSKRRKASSYRSALSMLTFYLNRAGSNLSASRRKVLERAKHALRTQFGKE
jgi:hypothetical protein